MSFVVEINFLPGRLVWTIGAHRHNKVGPCDILARKIKRAEGIGSSAQIASPVLTGDGSQLPGDHSRDVRRSIQVVRSSFSPRKTRRKVRSRTASNTDNPNPRRN